MQLGYLKVSKGEVFISQKFLTDHIVSKKGLLEKMESSSHPATSQYVFFLEKSTKELWINYSTIPREALIEYGLPTNSQKLVRILCDAIKKPSTSFNPHLYFLFNIIWEGTGNWERFIPYYKPYYLDSPNVYKLAKTHAIIKEILKIKSEKIYDIKTIFATYMELPNVAYKAGNLNYFYRKIREFEKGSIHEVLMHNFKVRGREPYRITSDVEALVKQYYISKKKYSISLIHRLVNLELVALDKPKISRSAVSRICNNPEFRNKADFIRYGSKYAEEKLIPYLKRKKVEKVGELYQIDGKDLRFKCLKDGEIVSLWITAVIDVYSGKVVGYSLDTKEDFFSVMTTLKMSFEKNKVIPKFIFYDNNGVTKTQEYQKLKAKLLDYGTVLKQCRVRNPKDKGHIENWFKLLNSNYMVFLKGVLGSGITAKSPNSRVNKDLERVYLSKSEIKSFEFAKRQTEQKIKKYNSDIIDRLEASPNHRFAYGKKQLKRVFSEHDIYYLFGELKEITVNRSKINLSHNGVNYVYQINDRHQANRYNRTRVRIYFFPLNPYSVHMFDMENRFVTKLTLEIGVDPVPKTKVAIEAMQHIYLKNIHDIKNNVKEILEEIGEGENQLLAEAPINILEDETYMELQDLKAEDYDLIMKEFALSKPYGKAISTDLLRKREEYINFTVDESREIRSID